MDIGLLLAGIQFRIMTEQYLNLDAMLGEFAVSRKEEDISIRVSWDWDNVRLPQTAPLGEDLICSYYGDGETRWCITRGGHKGPIACTVYNRDFSDVQCTIHEEPFLYPIRNLNTVLRMLPMREIFLHFGVLFLHASQIAYGGKGILFAAPSGTGKTTQAKLWQQYRGAEIVCNDRTLTRRIDGQWKTYGYPIDGSEPVHSSAVNDLGAVVLLEQGTENRVSRLRPVKALSRLMEQVVLDCWSGDARTAAMELLVNLMEDIPVYLLTCTADVEAVEVLEKILTEDEVIPDG